MSRKPKGVKPARYVIDEGVIAKSPLSTGDVIALLMLSNGVEYVATLKDLEERGYVVYFQGNYYLTPTSKDILRDLLLMAERTDDKEKAEDVAKRLVEAFPEGRRDNSPQHWRCSVRETSLRLREFSKMFGSYPADDIVDAAKRYVNSFGRDRRLMRSLKNFIWKVEEVDGVPQYTSDLAEWLENKDGDAKHKPNRIEMLTL